MKSEIFDFMAMKSAFMGFSRYFHGIFMKKIFIVTGVTLFALVLQLNCTALSQSESSNIFMYIIMT